MTPKQQYDARKAARDNLKDMDFQVRQRTESLMMLDMLDRFVTAAERIAEAMDRPKRADEELSKQLRPGSILSKAVAP